MRNIMAMLGLLVAAAIAEPQSAGVWTHEDEGCYYQACSHIIPEHTLQCSTVNASIQCAERLILNNTHCPDFLKNIAREEIYHGERYLEQHCSGTSNGTEPEVCPYETCLQILGEEANCWNVPEAILCGEGLVLSNSACAEDIRNGTRDAIRQGQAFLREHCQFNISGGSEKCDVNKCLEGVNTQGVTCQTVSDGINCGVETIFNNPDCDQNLIREVEERAEQAIYLLYEYCFGNSYDPNDVEVDY